MMEAQITFTRSIEVALSEKRSEVVTGLLYGGKIAFRHPVAGQYEGGGLKYFAKLSDLMHVIFSHLGYEIPSPLSSANKSFPKKLGQSFPQRRPAHLKLCCPILF